jgi:hypothetical protein
MEKEKIEAALEAIWNKYNDRQFENGTVKQVLFDGRKYVYAEPEYGKNILITGLNPSYQAKNKKILTPYKYSETDSSLFTTIKKTINHTEDSAYLDLFYYRQTEPFFLKEIYDEGPEGLQFLADQLYLTQHLIEEAKPKLIIVLSEESWVFWGKDPNFIWMGYNFEDVNGTNLKEGELLRITGLKYSTFRVAKDINYTALDGTLVYFSKSLNKADANTKKGIAEDMKKIFNTYL